MCCQSFIYESETFVPSQVQARSYSLSQVSSLCWPGQAWAGGWAGSEAEEEHIRYPEPQHTDTTHLEL